MPSTPPATTVPAGPAFPARIANRTAATVVTLVFVVVLPLVLLGVSAILPGVDGSPLGSEDALLRQAAGDAIALVVVAALVTLLGGWHSVVSEGRTRSRWGVVFLVGYALVAAATFTTPLRPDSGDYLGALAIAVVAVALVEELVYRGTLVAGFRRVLPEWVVWLLSTAAFALAHALGQGLDGLFQVQMTFVLGSAAYLARRVTGSIVGPVVVHVLYNAVQGFRTQTSDGVPFLLSAGSTLFLLAAAVVGLVVAIRHPRDHRRA
ncbi:CPBP family intramembrane metalloprotease [Curtobacterium albidum]|uniref:CPBP family intramembrane glutamic endopeptidase n=1 Tax=Curtobacterium citreum TaxID=2036 RepID=UPI0020262BED|nr:CPBP family intramembrane glutamic endopeptidase [Curtobacterium albidum]MCL9664651.1 CPBP family intramembrane metalloprotease [Curtobacterium albidum]